MKLEQTEKLFVETLLKESMQKGAVDTKEIVDLDRLTGDASTRRYYRAMLGSESYVICLDDPLAQGKVESNFVNVQRLLTLGGVRVPRIYDKDFSKGYLLEEDLGDETLLRRLAMISSPEEELSYYQRALGEIIKLHQMAVSSDQGWIVTTYAFDFEKLMWEMNFTLDYFVTKLLNSSFPRQEAALVQIQLQKICKSLSNAKMVVTHRDYHSRNIMVKKDELIVIDFQDARMGIPQYDLTSLLEDSYYELSQANHDRLKTEYFENFIKPNAYQGKEEFDYLYDLMTFQRVFKAIGSFSYIYAQRKDIRYLKYIGFGMEKIKNLLMKHSEFNDLRKTLVRTHYEN